MCKRFENYDRNVYVGLFYSEEDSEQCEMLSALTSTFEAKGYDVGNILNDDSKYFLVYVTVM